MRVLVTGATGFVGGHTAAALVRAGHRPRLLVRDRERAAPIRDELGLTDDDLVVGEMTDPAALRDALDGCDGLVHAAAWTVLKGGEQLVTTNRRGAQVVLRSAVQAGVKRIVHVSSVAALLPTHQKVLGPDAPLADPTSAYGRSKVAADRVARELQARGAPIVITYPSMVSGPAIAGAIGESGRGVLDQIRSRIAPRAGRSWMIDGRDLGDVHAAIIGSTAQVSERYVVAGNHVTMPQMTQLLRRNGINLWVIPGPGQMWRNLGLFSDVVSAIGRFHISFGYEPMAMVTRMPELDSSLAVRELGAHFRDPATTIADTLASFRALGLLPPVGS